MAELLETSSYFGLTLTLAIFWISHIGCRKLKISILNPILISSAIIIIILLCLDISYDTYEAGADLISKLLTPATICYAVPLYRQIEILKKQFVTIMISVACGSIASVLCVYGFSKLFHYPPEIYTALLPKSVTTAIGMGVSEELGGIVPITVAAIIVTGLFGSAIAVAICRLFKITDPVAKGLAIGTASHAVGTSKAIELGEVEGAMSGLAIVVAGLLTVVLSQIASGWI